MAKFPPDYVEYFRNKGKSQDTWKAMPESFKLILSKMLDTNLYSVDAIMDIYNLHRGEVTTKELRAKEIKEIYSEIWELTQRGFLERLVINEMILNKIRNLQVLIEEP